MIGRIKRRATFDALRSPDRRTRSGPVAVSFVVDGPGVDRAPGRPRVDVAYAVSRRVGSAVQRNRVRRRLRVLIDRHERLIPNGSVLVTASPGAKSCDFAGLDQAVSAALGGLSQ